MPWLATTLGLDELAVTTRLLAGVPFACTVKGMAALGVSSSIVWGEIVEMLGTPLTVTVKVRVTRLLLAWLSLTLTVMVTNPLELAVGVNVSELVAEGLA